MVQDEPLIIRQDEPLIARRMRRANSRREPNQSWSENIEGHREQTHIKVDLQTRMLQATFNLAKRSFEGARMRRANWWFQRIPLYLPDWVTGGIPDLDDFTRAYNLIHDWYPQLQEEVRVHRHTWEKCTVNVLASMVTLLENDDISGEKPGNKTGANDAFIKWAEDMIASKSNNLPEEDAKTTTIDNALFCQEKAEFESVRQSLWAMRALVVGPEMEDVSKAEVSLLFSLKAPLLRVMWIILLLDFLFIYEAIALGMLTQIFFRLNIDIEEAQHFKKPWQVFQIFLLPLAAQIYAIFGAVVADLVYASLQYSSFTLSRARLIITLTQMFTKKSVLRGELVPWPIWLIDVFMTDGLLALTVLFGVMFCVNPLNAGYDSVFNRVLDGLTCGALAWTCTFVVISSLSRFYCDIWLERKIDAAPTTNKKKRPTN